MPNKTKTVTIQQRLAEVATKSGIVLMAAAATIGMLELPEHPDKRVVVPHQPAFAFATENSDNNRPDNTLRREREETGPHYISYSVAQRTPGRTGKF
jgi:hypothetical protein